MDENIRMVDGVERIEIGATDEGFTLYIERKDGAGVSVPIESDVFDALERNFMLVDKTKWQPLFTAGQIRDLLDEGDHPTGMFLSWVQDSVATSVGGVFEEIRNAADLPDHLLENMQYVEDVVLGVEAEEVEQEIREETLERLADDDE